MDRNASREAKRVFCFIMNREIKFRMWDKRLNKMAFEGYHVVGEVTAFGGMEIWMEENKHLTPEVKSSIERWDDFVEMQYTGLKDRNGKEIYEGDVVRAQGQNHTYIQVIEFHNSMETCGRGWVGRNIIKEENLTLKTPMERIDDTFSYFSWPATWEVIGNIYENPELLKNG